jgi:radical SAM protein with 4Fe4S-binding SPASM domain
MPENAALNLPRILHQEPTGQVRLVEFERVYERVMTQHFGTRFRDYRQAWKLSADFDYCPSFPLSLDLEVNASCNMKCVMCVMGNPDYINPLAHSPLMDQTLYIRLMDQARQHGLPAMTFGFLSEPLLRPELADMIVLARASGVMDIRLGTNGALLSRKVSRKLIQSGLTRLEISVDAANDSTYRRIRRGAELSAIKSNILGFLEERDRAGTNLPLLRLSFLRLPDNLDEEHDFLMEWWDKADLFSIQEPIYFEDAPISRTVRFGPSGIDDSYQCAQPWQRLIVRANGDVYPCCSLYGLEMKIGSAEDSSIKNLWDRAAMDNLRALHREGRFRDNKICAHCAARSSLIARGPIEERQGVH